MSSQRKARLVEVAFKSKIVLEYLRTALFNCWELIFHSLISLVSSTLDSYAFTLEISEITW